MKKLSVIFGIILFILAGGAFFMGCYLQEHKSVAVIGGADGPTAIYVAANLNPEPFLVAAVIVLALAIALFLLFRKK